MITQSISKRVNDYFVHAHYISHKTISKMALAADVEIVLSKGQGEGQQDSDGSHNERKRKFRSPIWNYFNKAESNFAVCILCKSKYQHSNNTSNLVK